MSKILGVRYGEVIYAKEYEYKWYVIKEVERESDGWTLLRIYPNREWVPWNLYSLEKAKKLIDKFGDKCMTDNCYEEEYKGYAIRELYPFGGVFEIFPEKDWNWQTIFSVEVARALIDKFGDK